MFSPHYEARNFPVVRPEWLARRVEAAIDPGLPIVDAHHHLWDVATAVYHGADLAADAATGHDIRATVFVEAKSRYLEDGAPELRPVGETAFAVEQAKASGNSGFEPCAAIVGWADLRLGDEVQGVLERHLEVGEGRFRGVRVRAAWHADPEIHPAGEGQSALLLQAPVQRAVQRLATLGLTLDIWVFHTQLAEVAKLAAACPQATLVLDHCGGPLGIGPYEGHRDEVFKAWRADIASLARHDNIVVKLGGLGMPRIGFAFAQGEQPPGSAQLAQAWAPYIQSCIESFGATRCMFESNFPVDKGACSYAVIWNAFKRMTAGCSAEEKTSLHAGTAQRIYRIQP